MGSSLFVVLELVESGSRVAASMVGSDLLMYLFAECLSIVVRVGTGHAPFRRVIELAAQQRARHGLLPGTCVPPLDRSREKGWR